MHCNNCRGVQCSIMCMIIAKLNSNSVKCLNCTYCTAEESLTLYHSMQYCSSCLVCISSEDCKILHSAACTLKWCKSVNRGWTSSVVGLVMRLYQDWPALWFMHSNLLLMPAPYFFAHFGFVHIQCMLRHISYTLCTWAWPDKHIDVTKQQTQAHI